MARRSGAGDLAYYGALATLGFVGVQLGNQGQLGPAQGLYDSVKGALSGLIPGGTPIGGGLPVSPAPGSGGAPVLPRTSSPTGSALLLQLVAVNPNFIEQMGTWQRERRARGENPYDWDAFRRHEIAIYAPDPGPSAPSEFSLS